MITREQWLNRAIEELRIIFIANGVQWNDGLKVRASCGFPCKRALARKNRSIGECHSTTSSKDQTNEIFISPVESDPIEALAITCHELIHALDNCKSGHKGYFVKTMKQIGLEGKPTHTKAGDTLLDRLRSISEGLGTYPHKELSPVVKDKPQGTRLVKAVCSCCGYVIRTTRKWIEEAGLPTCPCGTLFTLSV